MEPGVVNTAHNLARMADGKDNKWLDKQVLHPDHVHELEKRAASLEFEEHIPRKAAETQAYREYRHDNHRKSSAHHLRGMKAAQAAGDGKAAAKHGAMFEQHMKALGHEPWSELPADVAKHMKTPEEEVHRFRAHQGDRFIVDEHKVQKSESLLHRLWEKATALQKAFPTDPSKPVSSGLGPHDLRRYKDAASGLSADPFASGMERATAQQVRAGGEFRAGKPATKATMRGATPDQLVHSDALQEQGFAPERPPAFKTPDVHFASGYGQPGVLSQAFSDNGKTIAHHPDMLGEQGQSIMGYYNQPARWGPGSSPFKRNLSHALDQGFWQELGRAVGINKAEPIQTAFQQGQQVHHRGENCVVTQVHPGRALTQQTLYTLSHPETKSVHHAFESELAPAQKP